VCARLRRAGQSVDDFLTSTRSEHTWAGAALGADSTGANASQAGAQAQRMSLVSQHTNKYIYDHRPAPTMPWMATGEGAPVRASGCVWRAATERLRRDDRWRRIHDDARYNFRLNQGLRPIDPATARTACCSPGTSQGHQRLRPRHRPLTSTAITPTASRLSRGSARRQIRAPASAGNAYTQGNSASLNTQGQRGRPAIPARYTTFIGGVNNAYTYGSLYPSLINRGVSAPNPERPQRCLRAGYPGFDFSQAG